MVPVDSAYYDLQLLLVFNGNVSAKSAPLRDICLQNLSDIQFDLPMS